MAVLPEHSDVSTQRLQKGSDVNLLQGLFTVVDGHQDVQGADAVRLLQTAEDTCSNTMAMKGCRTNFY